MFKGISIENATKVMMCGGIIIIGVAAVIMGNSNLSYICLSAIIALAGVPQSSSPVSQPGIPAQPKLEDK